jgi:hypothetical protein
MNTMILRLSEREVRTAHLRRLISGSPTFAAAKKGLQTAGLSPGAAERFARRNRPELFNQMMANPHAQTL